MGDAVIAIGVGAPPPAPEARRGGADVAARAVCVPSPVEARRGDPVRLGAVRHAPAALVALTRSRRIRPAAVRLIPAPNALAASGGGSLPSGPPGPAPQRTRPASTNPARTTPARTISPRPAAPLRAHDREAPSMFLREMTVCDGPAGGSNARRGGRPPGDRAGCAAGFARCRDCCDSV